MDPRQSIVDRVDAKQSRVIHYPGFIFLCGGVICNDQPDSSCSARDYLLKQLPFRKPGLLDDIEIAEDINTWWRDDAYSDLISFEQDIAELAGLIVVFLESAGAIAELAAFSQLSGIRKKLLVFIDGGHEKIDSFIVLGPIRFARKHDPESVRVYNWMDPNHLNSNKLDEALISDCISEIINDIDQSFDNRNHEAMFDCDSHRHQMLLVSDLIDLMLALTKSELLKYLKKFGVDIGRGRLTQYLFLLKQFGLIDEVKRGAQSFYISRADREFIKYRSAEEGERFNRQRAKYDARKYYSETKQEEKRFRAIKDVLKRMGGGDENSL